MLSLASSLSCRRTVLPSLARAFTTSKSCGQRTFTTTTTTTSSTSSNNSNTASTLASKKKQHQLFLLNRCTMAATTTSSRSKLAPPSTTATTTTSAVPQATIIIQQPLNRHFHSYSSSTSSSSPWSRRTFTTTTNTAQQQASQQQATSNKKRRTFLEWYEGHLEAHPVITKMFTGSLLWGIGDAVAQIVPQVAFTDNDDKKKKEQEQSPSDPASDSTTISSSPAASLITYDWPRTGRAALFGFALHAPTSHVHFNFLEWLTHRVGVTGGIGIPIFKAFMEQFVYWSWISNSMYHGAMGAMQGMTLQQIYDRIADVLWETQKAQWVFWIPVQLLNFRFVPVRHQLNVVLVTSIVWTALLSAWYPPQDDKKKDEEEENKVMDKEEEEDATTNTTANT